MKYLDATFETPAENLACDEAILRMCETGFSEDVLRFWEARSYFVVLGYSSKIHSEVDLRYCEQNDIPVLRRCTGGGAVLQGPGCFNFTVVLKTADSALLRSITKTNSHVLSLHREALKPLVGSQIRVQGTSDLTIGNLKFSGNAQRRTERFVLYHGTFLLDFDLSIIQKALALPLKQPPYRQNRLHHEFLTNAHIPRDALKKALQHAWEATYRLEEIPFEKTRELVRTRYSRREWTYKL